jgi:hypothetical protein
MGAAFFFWGTFNYKFWVISELMRVAALPAGACG